MSLMAYPGKKGGLSPPWLFYWSFSWNECDPSQVNPLLDFYIRLGLDLVIFPWDTFLPSSASYEPDSSITGKNGGVLPPKGRKAKLIFSALIVFSLFSYLAYYLFPLWGWHFGLPAKVEEMGKIKVSL